MQVLALLWILVAGCAGGPTSPQPAMRHFVLTVDECVGRHRPELLAGAALWAEVDLTFELGDGGVPMRCADPPEIESLGTTWEGRQVLLERLFVDAAEADFLIGCIAHELGHLAGLTHVDGRTSVMYWLAEGSVSLTDEDRAEARRVSARW